MRAIGPGVEPPRVQCPFCGGDQSSSVVVVASEGLWRCACLQCHVFWSLAPGLRQGIERPPARARSLAVYSREPSPLADALESLFDCVWRCERDWDFDDRIGLAARQRPR